jgi:hypothetical protein
MLSFVERIISLVLLFIIAPLPMSASPLDDGERFKMWREQTINKFITAYGGLLALNVFALMLPMIAKINFLPITGSLGSVINGIARLLFIIGGAFACRRGMVLVGNLVSRGAGSQDLMDQSHLSGGMASLAHMAGKLVRGTLGTAVGAAKGAFNKGRSWLQAAEVPTSIAEGIRYHTQMKKDREAEERRAAANRFDGRVDRGGQGGTNLQAVMQGNSPNSAKTSQATAKTGNPVTPVQPPAFHEKNNDANKNAQSDIKNALQNSKSQDKPDNNSHTT